MTIKKHFSCTHPPGYLTTRFPAAAAAAARAESLAFCQTSSVPKPIRGSVRWLPDSRSTVTVPGSAAAAIRLRGSVDSSRASSITCTTLVSVSGRETLHRGSPSGVFDASNRGPHCRNVMLLLVLVELRILLLLPALPLSRRLRIRLRSAAARAVVVPGRGPRCPR